MDAVYWQDPQGALPEHQLQSAKLRGIPVDFIRTYWAADPQGERWERLMQMPSVIRRIMRHWPADLTRTLPDWGVLEIDAGYRSPWPGWTVRDVLTLAYALGQPDRAEGWLERWASNAGWLLAQGRERAEAELALCVLAETREARRPY